MDGSYRELVQLTSEITDSTAMIDATICNTDCRDSSFGKVVISGVSNADEPLSFTLSAKSGALPGSEGELVELVKVGVTSAYATDRAIAAFIHCSGRLERWLRAPLRARWFGAPGHI